MGGTKKQEDASPNTHSPIDTSIHIDARLTDKGIEQCRQLAEQIRNAPPGSPLADLAENVELLITSPLTRCIQTTLYTMEPVLANRKDLPVVAHEYIRETVNYNCDKRRSIEETAKDFPMVDFSHIPHAHDAIWESYLERFGCHETFPGHRESGEVHVVAERAKMFMEWLADREENHVVMCSHAAFSRCLWNFGHEGTQATEVEQIHDDRGEDAVDIPVVEFFGEDKEFAKSMQRKFDNCELRSVVLAFCKQ